MFKVIPMAETKFNDIFEPIEDSQLIEKIWSDLFQDRIELHIKVGNSEKISLSPIRFVNSQMHFQVSSRSSLEENFGKEALGQFQLRTEKYFFRTMWIWENGNLSIPRKTSIYRLQRRQSFRLRVPDNFARMELKEIQSQKNAPPPKVSLNIFDLSVGGCCIVTQNEALFRIGETFTGELHISKKNPLKVTCKIKHSRTDLIHNKKHFFFGVQFDPLTPALESQLFTTMMELSRQYLRT